MPGPETTSRAGGTAERGQTGPYGPALSAVIGAGHDLSRLFDHLARRSASLTGSQFGLLSVLRSRDPQPCEPWELGRALGSGSAQVTALLDQLERAGLVERRTHGGDRRRRWVHLTDTGRARTDALAVRVRALEENLLAGHLTVAEAETLATLAGRLRAAVGELTATDLSFLLVADPGHDPARAPG